MKKNDDIKIIIEKGPPLPTEITIFLPIKFIKSKSGAYGLIFEDNSGKTHYFNKDGTYDGWSRKCKYCEN